MGICRNLYGTKNRISAFQYKKSCPSLRAFLSGSWGFLPEQHDPSLQAPKHGSRRFAYLAAAVVSTVAARRSATTSSNRLLSLHNPNTVALTFVSWHLGSCLVWRMSISMIRMMVRIFTRKSLPDPHIFVDWPPMVDSTDVVDSWTVLVQRNILLQWVVHEMTLRELLDNLL